MGACRPCVMQLCNGCVVQLKLAQGLKAIAHEAEDEANGTHVRGRGA